MPSLTGIQRAIGITNSEKVFQSTTGITKCDNYYKEWCNTSVHLKEKDTSLKAWVFLYRCAYKMCANLQDICSHILKKPLKTHFCFCETWNILKWIIVVINRLNQIYQILKDAGVSKSIINMKEISVQIKN